MGHPVAARFALVMLLVTGAFGGVARAETPTFPEIEALFAAGDFDATARRVNELLITDGELTAGRRAALYLAKARLELAFGREGEMNLWLAKAQKENPGLTLDPVKDPPPLVSALEIIRAAALPAPPSAQPSAAPQEERANQTNPADPLRQRLSHDALQYLPFGVAQAQNGEPTKALAVAGVHIGLLAFAVSTPEESNRQAALGLFALSWLYSAIDGRGARQQAVVLSPTVDAGIALAVELRW